MNIPVIISC